MKEFIIDTLDQVVHTGRGGSFSRCSCFFCYFVNCTIDAEEKGRKKKNKVEKKELHSIKGRVKTIGDEGRDKGRRGRVRARRNFVKW